MADTFLDTILLIALPASGKSEVRRYLMHEKREKRVEVFHLSDTVQLDDYPYVEFVRETDDALAAMGQARQFFKGAHDGFLHGGDWGTLLHLVNGDWEVMANPSLPTPMADANKLFDRIDAARAKVGVPPAFAGLDADVRESLASQMQKKAEWVVHELFSHRPDTIEGKTLVIEFARGGPDGADMPLSAPHGYGWNLAQLRPEILERAAVLYIWVDPAESRRKNAARNIPDAENTILFHAAPESVMLNDYGCDDIAWLCETSPKANTIPIHAHGNTYLLPIGRFDNRVDKTTFVRDEPETWDPGLVHDLHSGLKVALDNLWSAYTANA
jgi:hypothetical protein